MLEDELPAAARIGLGGIAPDVIWPRGPVRLGVTVAGIESVTSQHAVPVGPLRWEVPAVLCVACADGHEHDPSQRYLPAEHYRRIAADFLRLDTDGAVLAFVERWGMVQTHRLESRGLPTSEPLLEWGTLSTSFL